MISRTQRPCLLCETNYMPTSNRQKWCRSCVRTDLEMHRARLYGITGPVFDAMWSSRDGRCWICDKQITDAGHVDHDHATGRVRGILCLPCNVRLGVVEDAEWMAAAQEYLAVH